MKKLLILGGSGFIGDSIVNYGINKKLIKHKINEIYIISRSKIYKKNSYNHIKINYICKSILNIRKIPKVDYIIYCLKNKNINVSNTYFNKFTKLIEKLPKKPKILFTSSGAVYGKNYYKKKNKENKKINIKLINKLNGYKKNYAKEKIFIEDKFRKLGDLNYKVSIARCYTFIGNDIIRYKYAISDLVNESIFKSKILLKTPINVYRSYMHADDMVNWLIKILQYSNNKCPIFNVGSDKVIELRALANKVSKITNKKVVSKKQNSKRFDYYVPSINKAKKTLNLKISIGLNEALNSTIKHLNDSN